MSTDPAYARMAASLVASWRAFATQAPDAELREVGEASAAIFPRGPAAEIFNNALLRRTAVAERLYAAAGFRDLGRMIELQPPDSIATG